jgi:hypothetical protein
MRKNIGSVLVETKSENDFNILHLLNSIAVRKDVNFSLFTADFSMPMNQPKFFTVLPLHESKFYFGTLIVWDMVTLDMVTTPRAYPNVDKIIFYQNGQVPWMNNRNMPYGLWNKLYNNSKVQMFTDHLGVKEILANTWNTKCSFLHQITPEALYEIL